MSAVVHCKAGCGAQLSGDFEYLLQQYGVWMCSECTAKERKWILEVGSPMFCEHANENPSLDYCSCPRGCYCWDHTCRYKSKGLRPLPRGQVAVLRWAASRPGVLALLEALRAANYDETGTEYLRRIVSRQPPAGSETKNAGKDWFVPVGLRHGVCEVDYSQEVSLPVGPEDFGGEDVPVAPALKVKAEFWEGRECCVAGCKETATSTVWSWGWGAVPVCDRHRKTE